MPQARRVLGDVPGHLAAGLKGRAGKETAFKLRLPIRAFPATLVIPLLRLPVHEGTATI